MLNKGVLRCDAHTMRRGGLTAYQMGLKVARPSLYVRWPCDGPDAILMYTIELWECSQALVVEATAGQVQAYSLGVLMVAHTACPEN
jgi:hypothetical protein